MCTISERNSLSDSPSPGGGGGRFAGTAAAPATGTVLCENGEPGDFEDRTMRSSGRFLTGFKCSICRFGLEDFPKKFLDYCRDSHLDTPNHANTRKIMGFGAFGAPDIGPNASKHKESNWLW